MSVVRRKDTKSVVWQARWTDLNGDRKSRSFKTKAEAIAYEARMKNEIAKGEYSDPQRAKERLHVIYEDWQKSYSGKKPKTYASVISIWKCLLEEPFGNKRLSTITRGVVKTWLSEGKSSTGQIVSSSRMRQGLVLLNQLLDHAVEMEYLNKNPLGSGFSGKSKGLLPKQVSGNQKRTLSQVELMRLIEASKDYSGLIALAGQTGLRWAEVIALTPEDFDLKTDTFTVNKSLTEVSGALSIVSPKNNKVRSLPLPELSKKLLLPLILSTESGKEIFRSPEGGFLRHSNFMKRVFRPALKEAGIEDFTFHELRHTAVSHLIASGANIVTVSKIIGHSNPSITLDVYSHLLPDAFEGVRKAMDANFDQKWENILVSGN